MNIAARIESFAVPGGVMLSDAAHDQIGNRSDVGLVSLGRFKLKNVGRLFDLYAVAADGVVVPDPDTLEGKGERFASLPSNLPSPGGSLIGRAHDLSALAGHVREHRVVTITGPGGVRKTRDRARPDARARVPGRRRLRLPDGRDRAGRLPGCPCRRARRQGGRGEALGDGLVSLTGDRKALLLLDNME